jgi:hypothetical protein
MAWDLCLCTSSSLQTILSQSPLHSDSPGLEWLVATFEEIEVVLTKCLQLHVTGRASCRDCCSSFMCCQFAHWIFQVLYTWYMQMLCMDHILNFSCWYLHTLIYCSFQCTRKYMGYLGLYLFVYHHHFDPLWNNLLTFTSGYVPLHVDQSSDWTLCTHQWFRSIILITVAKELWIFLSIYVLTRCDSFLHYFCSILATFCFETQTMMGHSDWKVGNF